MDRRAMLQSLIGAGLSMIAGCGREPCELRARELEDELAALRRVVVHAPTHGVFEATPGDPAWEYRAPYDSIWLAVRPSELPPLFVTVVSELDGTVGPEGAIDVEGAMALDLLRSRLARAFTTADAEGPRVPAIVSAHPSIPTASVREVLAVAAAFSPAGRVDVAFRREQPLPLTRVPPPPELRAVDEAFRHPEYGVLLPTRDAVKLGDRIFGDCPMDLSPVAAAPARERGEMLDRRMVAAFRECGCRADERTILWWRQLVELPETALGVLPLVSTADGLELSGTTWLEASRMLLAVASRRSDPLQPVAVQLAAPSRIP